MKKSFLLPVQIIIFLLLLSVDSYGAQVGKRCSSAESVSVPSTITATLKYKGWEGSYYYYKFTAPTDGSIHIWSSGASYDTDLRLENDGCGSILKKDTSDNHDVDLTYDVVAGTTYIIKIYNYGRRDSFPLHIDFTPDSGSGGGGTIESAEDMCYDEPYTEGFCFGSVNFACKYVIPVRNIGSAELSQVRVVVAANNLFSFMSDCGTDDTSGNCQEASGISFWQASGFNSAINYDLQNMSSNEMHTIYNKSLFSFLNNEYGVYATYMKDGVLYQGELAKCENETQSGGRPFELRYKKSLYGDVKVLGNTILCKKVGGVCVESTQNNAHVNLQKVPQSQAKLELPQDAKIIYARLYWQGRDSYNSSWTTSKKEEAKTIRLRKTGDAYSDVTADVADFDMTSGGTIPIYSASANVIDIVHEAGWYEVEPSSFYTITGDTPDGLGAYGAWTLVVVYQDPNSDSNRLVTIFDGFQQITTELSEDPVIETDGFLTPRSGEVDSQAYLFVAEGDRDISGDTIEMAGKRYNTTFTDIDSDNAFNSRIDVDAPRTPDMNNNFGIDIHKYEVGTANGGLGILTQNETGAKFRFHTTQDYYFADLVVFSTELYVPQFCYDYAYAQNGIYFTEENDGSKDPEIVGEVATNANVDVKIYVRNKVDSDLEVKNMTVNIYDINTSQAKYVRDSVRIAMTKDLTPHRTSVMEENDAYVHGIDIGDIAANDYFYVYYQIDPIRASLHMPLHVQLQYDLKLDESSTIPYIRVLAKDVEMCSSANFEYQPEQSIFNVVHESYYDADEGGDNAYYNLPTQVVFRAGKFKVIALDPDNRDTLKSVSTMAAVEMIDASAFHDVNASCKEMDSSISKRVWVLFDDEQSTPFDQNALENAIANGQTDLDSLQEFYTMARKNTAFRVSYNVVDENNSLLEVENLGGGKYRLTNFPSYSTDSCSAAVTQDDPDATISAYCGSTGAGSDDSGMNIGELSKCMECIYGYRTQFVCSRDNFSIRPEAFSMRLIDGNDTIPDVVIENDGNEHIISAGYEYKLEINATTYTGEGNAQGYTGSIGNENTDRFAYMWLVPDGIDLSGCNDTSDKNMSTIFLDGENYALENGLYTDLRVSLHQVGKYRLALRDRTWTKVDSDAASMQHHTGAYFKPASQKDCKEDSGIVVPIGSTLLNGCEIWSEHNNTNISPAKYYHDYWVESVPYRFDVTDMGSSVGLNNDDPASVDFVYTADMQKESDGVYKDLNMSYHIYGVLEAQDKQGSGLSNFVEKCYAKTVEFDLPRSKYENEERVFTQSVEAVDDQEHRLLLRFNDVNDTVTVGEIEQKSFAKAQNGKANLRIRYNFKRLNHIAQNPKRMTFTTFSVKCKNESECVNLADGNSSYMPQGSVELDDNITFLYVKAHAKKTKINGSTGDVNITYEVFCSDSEDCNKTLLPDKSCTMSDDPRWCINTKHTPSFGSGGDIEQKRTNGHISVISLPTGTYPDKTTLEYDEKKGYPYRATMKMKPNEWLIYNKYNADADHNEFEVEFQKEGSKWIGSGETDTSSTTEKFGHKDRKLTW